MCRCGHLHIRSAHLKDLQTGSDCEHVSGKVSRRGELPQLLLAGLLIDPVGKLNASPVGPVKQGKKSKEIIWYSKKILNSDRHGKGLPYTFLWLHDVFILHFKLEVEIDHNLFSALESLYFSLALGSGQTLRQTQSR